MAETSSDEDIGKALLTLPKAHEERTKSTPEGMLGKKMKKSKFSNSMKVRKGKRRPNFRKSDAHESELEPLHIME